MWNASWTWIFMPVCEPSPQGIERIWGGDRGWMHYADRKLTEVHFWKRYLNPKMNGRYADLFSAIMNHLIT